MLFRRVAAITGVLWVASVQGCASNKASADRESATAAQQQAAASLASERQDKLRAAREWLDELNDRIVVLVVKVHEEGDEEQREQWGELLFQLRQERNRLDAELIDARDLVAQGRAASGAAAEKVDGEWQARLTVFKSDLMRLETAVNRTAFALAHELAGGEMPASGEPSEPVDVDLCQLQVTGTEAEVLQEGDVVIVHLSAPDPEAVEALQARTEEQLRAGVNDSPGPSGANPSATTVPAEELHVAATPDGVVFIFAPEAGELAELKARLEQAVEHVEKRRC